MAKNSLSEDQSRILSIFINFSVCKSSNSIKSLELTSHKVVHSINEKGSCFLKNMRFGVKNKFSGIPNPLVSYDTA